MSFLGFDAIGRLALGQSQSNSAVLFAPSGSYAETGHAATFAVSLNGIAASYAFTGNVAFLTTGLLTGTFHVTGFAVSDLILEADGQASYVFTGNAATLTRDFVNWLRSSDLAAPAWSQESPTQGTWTPQNVTYGTWTIEPVVVT